MNADWPDLDPCGLFYMAEGCGGKNFRDLF